MRPRRSTKGARRTWALTAVVALAAAGLLPLVSGPAWPSLDGPGVPWWLLAIGFGVAEVFVMHLRIGRHAHSFSLSELPLVIGLALATPGEIVVAQALGVGFALAAHRRQRPLRLAFNVSQRSLTAVLAMAVFAGVVGAVPEGWPGVWLAAFAAMLVADVVAAVLINTAISLSEGAWMLFDQVVGIGTALTVANTALGVVAVMVIRENPVSILLVALPAATTFLAGKAYADIQRKHDDLVLLERSTRLAQGSLQLREMLPPLLEHVREMFRADVAELVLSPTTDRDPHLGSWVGPGSDTSVMQPMTLDVREGVWARVAAEREGIVLPRPIRNQKLAEYFGARGIVDAVVAPVQSDDELLGTLMVANRVGDFSSFGTEDLKLLETLANHVGVAIRNTQLVGRLEDALAHETEISRLKDDFVATISHELRTPLTSVKGYIKTLLRPDVELSDPERREFLERTDLAAERLRSLIEDLLFASRIESSRPTVADDVVSVHAMVGRVVEERSATLEDPGRLAVFGTHGLPTIRTNDEHVYRILGNLVDNALKYSASTVTISAREDDGGVRISVRDQGAGIPREEQSRIFERFYQVDQSHTRLVGGAGMGLYICRKAAAGLGGRVWLERSDASGSVFSLWLPLEPTGRGDASAETDVERLVVVHA
jgi:signal transduction histidine kinase